MNDEIDTRLRQALRHAPDRDLAPPAEVDRRILDAARAAVRPPPARGWRAWLDALTRPAGAAALASVVLATVIGVIWRDGPPPEGPADVQPEAASSRAADPAASVPAPAPAVQSEPPATPAPTPGRSVTPLPSGPGAAPLPPSPAVAQRPPPAAAPAPAPAAAPPAEPPTAKQAPAIVETPPPMAAPPTPVPRVLSLPVPVPTSPPTTTAPTPAPAVADVELRRRNETAVNETAAAGAARATGPSASPTAAPNAARSAPAAAPMAPAPMAAAFDPMLAALAAVEPDGPDAALLRELQRVVDGRWQAVLPPEALPAFASPPLRLGSAGGTLHLDAGRVYWIAPDGSPWRAPLPADGPPPLLRERLSRLR